MRISASECARSDRGLVVAAPGSSRRSENNPQRTAARPRLRTTARGQMMRSSQGCVAGASPCYRARRWVCVPAPVTPHRHVSAIAGDVLTMFDQPVLHLLLEVIAATGDLRQTIDDVLDKVESIHIVQDRHIERGRDRAFLLVSAHMQVHVVPAAVGEAM